MSVDCSRLASSLASTRIVAILAALGAFPQPLHSAPSTNPQVVTWSITPSDPFGDEAIEFGVEFVDANAEANACFQVWHLDPDDSNPGEYEWLEIPLAWNAASGRFEGVIPPIGRSAAVEFGILATPTPGGTTTWIPDVGSFTVRYARPRIDSLSPDSGPLQSIGQVSIVGSGFLHDVDSGSLVVEFGGDVVPASKVTVIDDGEIRVVPPDTATAIAKAVSLRVDKWGEHCVAVAPYPYSYSGSLRIDAYTPHGAPGDTAFQVRLSGSGYSSQPDPIVRIGEHEATEVVIESDSSLLASFARLPANDAALPLVVDCDTDSAAIEEAFKISIPRFRKLQSHSIDTNEPLHSISQAGRPDIDFGAVALLVGDGDGSIVRQVPTSNVPWIWEYFFGTSYAGSYGVASTMLAFGDIDLEDYYLYGDEHWLFGIPTVLDQNWFPNENGVVESRGYDSFTFGILDDRLGHSLLGIVDANHDGYWEWAAAGAPGARRIAWLYAVPWDPGGIQFGGHVTGGGADDGFGESLGTGSDPLGKNYLAVGGPRASPAGIEHAGSVWLYRFPEFDSDSYVPPAGLEFITRFDFDEPDATSSGDGNTMGLAVLPDIDGNGAVELVVGLPGANGGRGSVRTIDAATKTELWRIDGLQEGDALGDAISLGSDFDHDGFPDLVVSAPNDDGAGIDAGSVSVVSGVQGATLDRFTMAPGSHAGHRFLYSSDVDRDGMPEVVVGSDPTESGILRVDRHGLDPRGETWTVFPGSGIAQGLLNGASDRDGLTIDMKAGEEVRAVIQSLDSKAGAIRFIASNDAGEVLASNWGNPCFPATETWPSCPEHVDYQWGTWVLRVRVDFDTTVHFLAYTQIADAVIPYELSTQRTMGKVVHHESKVAALPGTWSECAFPAEKGMRARIDLKWSQGHYEQLELLAPNGTDLLATHPWSLFLQKAKKGKSKFPIRARIGPKGTNGHHGLALPEDGEYRLRVRAPSGGMAKVRVSAALFRAVSWMDAVDQD